MLEAAVSVEHRPPGRRAWGGAGTRPGCGRTILRGLSGTLPPASSHPGLHVLVADRAFYCGACRFTV